MLKSIFDKLGLYQQCLGVSGTVVELVDYYKNASGVNLPRRKAKVLECIRWRR